MFSLHKEVSAMQDFFYSPWVVGIGGGLAVGFITWLVRRLFKADSQPAIKTEGSATSYLGKNAIINGDVTTTANVSYSNRSKDEQENQ